MTTAPSLARSRRADRRPRTHDPEGRRAAVLEAARRLFAERGFAQTSIRAIAAAADVNQALVTTYFGGKEALFMEAVRGFEISQGALAGGIEGMGARLARLYMDRWEHKADDDPWPALIKSALSHEASERLLRSTLERQAVAPLRQVLGESPDGLVRTALVRCLITGMIMERFVYAHEPARSVPGEAFEASLADALQHAISGPLDTEGAQR